MDEEIIKTLNELVVQEKKNNSLRATFLRGVFSGFGVFVGSVLLAALFIYLLSLFDTAPIIGRWISFVNDTIKRSTGK